MDETDDDADLSRVCSSDYSPEVKRTMAALGEKDTSFEIIVELLKYIKSELNNAYCLASKRYHTLLLFCQALRFRAQSSSSSPAGA